MPEVTVKVARVKLHGQPQVEVLPAAEVQVPSGRDLVVKATFEFSEASHDRDDYKLVLRSRVGHIKAEDSVVVLRDQPVIADEGIGMVQQRYRGLRPGSYTLAFELLAGWASSSWSGGQRKDNHARATGEVQVVVA